jgi:putative DNA primase/helicase
VATDEGNGVMTNETKIEFKPLAIGEVIENVFQDHEERAIVEASLFNLTDRGNGQRYALYHSDKIKYDWDTATWLYYDGKRWNPKLGEEAARQCAKGTALNILKEAAIKNTTQERETTAKWAIQSEREARLNAMMSLARSEKPIAAYKENFDTDRWLLNCKNGIINLKIGRCLYPHHQDFQITKLANVVYDETAECPLWLECVNTWMAGDKSKIDYLQRLLGMCLTGEICSRVLSIWYGGGKNGKSTGADVVLEIMGDYGSIGLEDLLEQKIVSQHPCEIADLMGKRFVIVDETKPNMKLRTSLVKRMTGDRKLKGRFMRQNPFDFHTTHKTILMTQNLPVVTETSDAIWDRVHLLSWTVRITDEQQDPHLFEKLYAESSGVLNWLIEGCLKWQQDGCLLKRPKSVETATQEYREESDPLNEFVAECCEIGNENLTVSKKDLRTAYNQFAARSETKWIISAREFNTYFRQNGKKEIVSWQTGKGVKCWSGIGLKVDINQSNQFN